MRDPALSAGRTFRYGAEAIAFFFFMGFFRLLGLDAASALGGFIGREIFRRTSATKRARDNLRAAFPEKNAAEIEAIIRIMWGNLGRTVAEYAHLDKFDLAGRDPRITIEQPEIIDTVRGKGVLILSGHFANWEIMPITAACLGIAGAIVYRPPNNPYVARYIAHMRGLRGFSDQISKHQGTRRIFTFLRGGKAILLLADQKTNEGIAAPFFGRDVMTTPAPAALALRLKVPILFASARRTSGARFVVRVHPTLAFSPSGNIADDTQAMTAAINARLEDMVRADPAQWLWIHRRWPTPRDQTTGKRL